MSQSNHELQSLTAFQKQTLSELGIRRWQLSDSAQLVPELAKLHTSAVAVEADEKPGEASSSDVSESKTSASDVIAQLSNQLSDKKTKEFTPEPEAMLVEEVLLQGLTGQLAQDITLAFERLGITVITAPYDKRVRYPLVISDNGHLKDHTTHFFSADQLRDGTIKKQLWQAMQQG